MENPAFVGHVLNGEPCCLHIYVSLQEENCSYTYDIETQPNLAIAHVYHQLFLEYDQSPVRQVGLQYGIAPDSHLNSGEASPSPAT